MSDLERVLEHLARVLRRIDRRPPEAAPSQAEPTPIAADAPIRPVPRTEHRR